MIYFDGKSVTGRLHQASFQSAQLRLRVVPGEKKASDIYAKRTILNVFVCENEREVRFCVRVLSLNLYYARTQAHTRTHTHKYARTHARTHTVWEIVHIYVVI